MQNSVVLVTGASDGIGFVCAQNIAARGAKVILVGRDERKCADAVATIRNSTDNGKVSFQVADLSLLRDLRALAGRILDKHGHIDVLLNNAGGFYRQRRITAEGLEYTFALNHMGYFVLTDLLLPALKQSNQGRIVNVASRAHRNGTVNFQDLQGQHSYAGWPAYCQSKLMNVMFTYAQARRLTNTPITVNSLHPGFVRSKFGHNNPGFAGLTVRLSQILFAISPEAGAKTPLHLACAPELADSSGQYYEKCQAVISSPESLDTAAQERLWQLSAELAGSIP
ncbi:MAG: SDR family oxidoreductase [Proteobacteria bacterium]|nr:SDR family oxidoreductase [Pseudomonadota bacterium]